MRNMITHSLTGPCASDVKVMEKQPGPGLEGERDEREPVPRPRDKGLVFMITLFIHRRSD